MALHYHTVTPLLRKTLEQLMSEPLFTPFRLVGGTNLSLRFGHRMSDDIDLFSDAEYRSLYFPGFEEYLHREFAYCDCTDKGSIVGFGRTYYVGDSASESVKLDLMYTDLFLSAPDEIDGLRMASVEDLAAMKLNVVSRGGRKKDFWDLHYLLTTCYGLDELLSFHARRYPWEHDESSLVQRLRDFSIADQMPDPRCLTGNTWEDIKLDFIEWTEDRQANGRKSD